MGTVALNEKEAEADRLNREMCVVEQARLRMLLQIVRHGVGPNKGKLVFDTHPKLREVFADTLD